MSPTSQALDHPAALARAEALLDAAPVAGVDLDRLNEHRIRLERRTADYERALEGEAPGTAIADVELAWATELWYLVEGYKKLVAAVEAER